MSVKSQINKITGVDRSDSQPDINSFFNKRTDYKTKLANRNYEFANQVDNFVINSEARMLAVVRTAISNVIEESQKPVAKAGKMRVKTGFLRASGIANLNSPPVGETKGDPKGSYAWAGEAVNSVLVRLKAGDVFHFGWTAHYAKYREAYDGFLESALMNWQAHVDKATDYFRKRM